MTTLNELCENLGFPPKCNCPCHTIPGMVKHIVPCCEQTYEKSTTEPDDHLAKVAWFCVTQMELERLEQLDRRLDRLDPPL